MNPPQKYVIEGYPLGAKVNRIRQYRKRGLLTQADIEAYSAAGIIWEVRRKAKPKSFDDYYAELLRYHAQNGHIRVPQSYVVPETGCKLGTFIQRVRLMKKGKATGKLTDDQIVRLDALGMIWEAGQNCTNNGGKPLSNQKGE